MAQQNRRSVYLVALGIVAVGGLVGWWLEQAKTTVTRQAPVISGSMATAAPGPHYSLMCYDCEIPLQVDASTVSETSLPICFNCGATNDIEGLSPQINSVKFDQDAQHDLQRWAEVVFEYQQEQYIKRVVGLPGEEISLEGGELYIGTELYQKTLDEFDQLKVRVFDSRFQPADPAFNLLNRFGVRGDDSGWIFTTDKSFSFDAEEKTHPQWLDYHQWNIVAGFVPPVKRGTSSAIFDYLPFNQFVSRSRLNFVDDFVVDLQLKVFEPGVVRVRMLDAEIELDFHLFNLQVHQSRFLRGSSKIAPIQWNPQGTSITLRLGRLDGRVVVKIGDQVDYFPLIELQLNEDYESDLLVRKVPVSVSVDEGVLDLNEMTISRDIYWLAMDYSSAHWTPEHLLQRDEYFLMGDNQSISRDCRHWGEGITRDAILGLVLEQE